jgi:hypothetical protein
MGLDITAYRRLKPEPEAEFDEDRDLVTDDLVTDDLVLFGASQEWSESMWPGRAAPIELGVYSFADSFRFRAGSYSGYNEWRRILAAARPNEAAFEELIDFADNEGTIGTVASAKLHGDFVRYREEVLARVPPDERDWFETSYNAWMQAFEIASDGGAVKFH